MRRPLVFAAALLAAGGAAAQSEIVVPPAPPVVAAPAAPLAPAAPSSPAAPPPGLVQTPLPPNDSGASDAGNYDSGTATPANSDDGSGQAVSPALPPSQAAPEQAAGQSSPAQPAVPDVAPAPPNAWTQDKTAQLGVLNKVDGSSASLSIPVGGQAVVGDLTVSVQACLTRPEGALPDAAVFLTVTPSSPDGDSPLFHGWLLRSAPGAADAGNAGQAFRVINCS